MPRIGAEPTQDHEEGAIRQETAVPPGRFGAALSRIAGVLALSRTVARNGIILRILPTVKRTLFRLNSVGCGSRIFDNVYLQGGICVAG